MPFSRLTWFCSPIRRLVFPADLFLETLEGEIVFAHQLHEIPTGPRLIAQGCRPGFRITLRIVKGEGDLQELGIHAMDALGDVHLLAFRMAQAIKPVLSIQTDRIDDQSVTLPMADGMAV